MMLLYNDDRIWRLAERERGPFCAVPADQHRRMSFGDKRANGPCSVFAQNEKRDPELIVTKERGRQNAQEKKGASKGVTKFML